MVANFLRPARTGALSSTAIATGPGDVHGSRYPKHADALKGQVHGGECNRTACKSQGATYWNCGTYGLYCAECARAINDTGAAPLCVKVSAKPDLARMADLARDFTSKVLR